MGTTVLTFLTWRGREQRRMVRRHGKLMVTSNKCLYSVMIFLNLAWSESCLQRWHLLFPFYYHLIYNITLSYLDCKTFEFQGCLFPIHHHINKYLINTQMMLFKGINEPGEIFLQNFPDFRCGGKFQTRDVISDKQKYFRSSREVQNLMSVIWSPLGTSARQKYAVH